MSATPTNFNVNFKMRHQQEKFTVSVTLSYFQVSSDLNLSSGTLSYTCCTKSLTSEHTKRKLTFAEGFITPLQFLQLLAGCRDLKALQ